MIKLLQIEIGRLQNILKMALKKVGCLDIHIY